MALRCFGAVIAAAGFCTERNYPYFKSLILFNFIAENGII